jgi:chromosome segregation ATPase
MGLFRRNTGDRQQIEEMRAELYALRARLDRADAEKADLERRIADLDADNLRLQEGLGRVDEQVGLAGALRTDVDRLAERVKTPPPPPPPDPRVGVLENRLHELERLADQVAALDARSDDITGELRRDLGQVADQVAALDTRSDDITGELRRDLGQVAEKMTSVDSRVAQVSVELANQLTELSNELDALDRRTADQAGTTDDTDHVDEAELIRRILDQLDPRVDERVDGRVDERVDTAVDEAFHELADGQERLANEQARYQIQFRRDLAELVEQLRRRTDR